MSTQKKHIILKLKPTSDNEDKSSESNDKKKSNYFPYVRFRDNDLIDNVENGDKVIYKGDSIIINVAERYRYKPIPVKVYLKPTDLKSNVPRGINYFKFEDEGSFQDHREELEKICGRDVFNEIYPLWQAYNDKIQELYMESFKDSCFVSQRVINEYKKVNGLTIKSLLQILNHLIKVVYPEEIMGDMGISCSLSLDNDTVSYNMN